MYTSEQTTDMLNRHTADIAALKESTKSAHHRIDGFEKIVASIDKLAQNVATMAAKVELLAETTEKNIGRLESAQKSQGERFGESIRAIELSVQQVQRNEVAIEKQAEELKTLMLRPAKKWESLVGYFLAGGVGALFAFLGTLLGG